MIDFRLLNRLLDVREVVRALGLDCWQEGPGLWRGRCPFHESHSGRSLSVSAGLRVWQCHSRRCRRHGDLIDLWGFARRISLVEAARELIAEFRIPATDVEARFLDRR